MIASAHLSAVNFLATQAQVRVVVPVVAKRLTLSLHSVSDCRVSDSSEDSFWSHVPHFTGQCLASGNVHLFSGLLRKKSQDLLPLDPTGNRPFLSSQTAAHWFTAVSRTLTLKSSVDVLFIFIVVKVSIMIMLAC